MKQIAALALATCAFAPAAWSQTSVGVSIGINQPGVYGRIDIGNTPPPRVIYPKPVVIVQSPVAVYQRPIYMYVPPGHQKKWNKYCNRYAACGQPVYFVQENWVRERYDHRHDHDDHGWQRGRYDRDNHGRGHGHGPDRGPGRGHDKKDWDNRRN
jgi:hypothetical protein